MGECCFQLLLPPAACTLGCGFIPPPWPGHCYPPQAAHSALHPTSLLGYSCSLRGTAVVSGPWWQGYSHGPACKQLVTAVWPHTWPVTPCTVGDAAATGVPAVVAMSLIALFHPPAPGSSHWAAEVAFVYADPVRLQGCAHCGCRNLWAGHVPQCIAYAFLPLHASLTTPTIDLPPGSCESCLPPCCLAAMCIYVRTHACGPLPVIALLLLPSAPSRLEFC